MDKTEEEQKLISHQQPQQETTLHAKILNNLGGLICAAIMVTDWVAYAAIIQIYTDHYSKPFFIRYVALSFYALWIIPWYFIYKRSIKKLKMNNKSTNILSTTQFIKTLFFPAIIIGILAFFQGYLWYISLQYTMLAANNTIYQSQCVFVLLYSSCFLKTKITISKIFAVIIAICGVALVSFGTKDDSSNITVTWYGYVIAIISMMGYALQTVLTKFYGDKYFRNGLEIADDFMLLTLMGFACLLLLWPGIFVVDLINSNVFGESFIIPKTFDEIMAATLPIVLEAVFVASFMTGITLTSPMLISLSAMAVIPLSFALDVILHGIQITAMAIFGSLLIFASFIMIEMPIPKMFKRYFQKRKTYDIDNIDNNSNISAGYHAQLDNSLDKSTNDMEMWKK
eukprot:351691_1